MNKQVCVYLGEPLADYHFGAAHPFGPQRLPAFEKEFYRRRLHNAVSVCEPVSCSSNDLRLFHDSNYIDFVKSASDQGKGYLDGGDTPVRQGIYEAACFVVGSTLDGVDRIMRGECQRSFIPIAGLHHARRNSAAGFCVFNDCGVAIEKLFQVYGLESVAYVDIDAHHGDGVFYGFEDNPALCYVDFHEDGRFLYPGTGAVEETGKNAAKGTKLNIPMPMYADDQLFFDIWSKVEAFVVSARPQFILLQCGVDSVSGDPITHLQYTSRVHAHVTKRLCELAVKLCEGRFLAMGGGGYNLDNLALTWNDVVAAMAES